MSAMMFEPGQPVKYRNRHYVFVRRRPGFPETAIIRDDEGEDLVVEVRLLTHA